ncbi:uncharacterized protein DUF1761 [Albidovulum inexpectatum]|uniref:Uncharacterized protein DUF1761 n=2 Tax=Albidovulum inexpectatum TaxID=196587 RepID=A0A2S5JLT0_9RHOB|nr:DUF1761 domain-containing protein [Albidovulum inexpectatum]PPB82444.1 uncharacterized protein DUF1761 [Albidovulum inexpectatum]
MALLTVIIAAAACWFLGAIYYMALARQWVRASGIPVGPDGRPKGSIRPAPFILSALCLIVVAGMMRHVLAMSGITTLGSGFVSGAGIGLFFIAPWIAINNAYALRPTLLTLIDGGYAVAGCALMGAVIGAML